MHHATRVRVDPTLTLAARQATIGDAILRLSKSDDARRIVHTTITFDQRSTPI